MSLYLFVEMFAKPAYWLIEFLSVTWNRKLSCRVFLALVSPFEDVSLSLRLASRHDGIKYGAFLIKH